MWRNSRVKTATLPSSDELLAELAGRSLSRFVRTFWPVVEPGHAFLSNWHVDYVAEHLEAVTAGEIHRLAVNIPPRYMKSLLVSVFWPAWEWTDNPSLRYLFASYAASLSTKHSLDRRRILTDERYRLWYPGVELTGDQATKTEVENTARGTMVSTSVGGTATGKGGDRIVVDDPINPEEAYSDTKRETANRFFDHTLSTRLDDKKAGAIVLIMQRLHDDDPTGHVLEEDADEWVVVKLPAEAPEKVVVHFPRSGREVVREAGEPLWEGREDKAELARMRKRLGPYGYAAQYQQEPVPLTGGLVDDSWWRFYLEPPRRFDLVLQSWDCTFKDLETSDYVVGQVWGRVGARKYLLDEVRGKWDIVKTIAMVRRLSAKWPAALTKLVEDKANGTAVIAMLRRELPGLIPVEPQGGKVARLMAVLPTIEAGDVYLPDPKANPWVDDYRVEFRRFPRGKHDDRVDATSQALVRLDAGAGAPRKVRCN